MFVQIVGSLAAGIIWGNLSHRKGNKFLIQSGLTANLITIFIAIFLSFSNITHAMPYLMIMVFIAGILLGNWLGFISYLLDIVSDVKSPAYIALTSTILFPFTLVPFAGGIIAEAFGFSTVFIIVAVFITVSLIISFKLKNKDTD
jgi:MFS family permease